MSTSGGAAGLTLTAARTAFILEPSLNPGLEAQAAARICRLGAPRLRQPALLCSACDAFCLPLPPRHGRSPSPAPPPACAGQTQPTRVVRLLADDSVERCILEVQRRKLERGEVPGGDAAGPASALADVDAGMLLHVYGELR